MSKKQLLCRAVGSGFSVLQTDSASSLTHNCRAETGDCGNDDSVPSPKSLARDLVKITAAGKALNISRATFWRFRKRHRIQTLTGATVCWDDIVAAIDAERAGKRLYQITGGTK